MRISLGIFEIIQFRFYFSQIFLTSSIYWLFTCFSLGYYGWYRFKVFYYLLLSLFDIGSCSKALSILNISYAVFDFWEAEFDWFYFWVFIWWTKLFNRLTHSSLNSFLAFFSKVTSIFIYFTYRKLEFRNNKNQKIVIL